MVAGPEEVCKPHVHGCEIHKPQDLKRSRGFFRLGFFRLGFFRLGFFRLGFFRLGFFRLGFFRLGFFRLGFFRLGFFRLGFFRLGFFRLGFFRLGFFRLGFFRLDTVVWALSFVRRVSQFSTGSTRRKYFKIRLFHVVQPPNGARRANGSKEKWS